MSNAVGPVGEVEASLEILFKSSDHQAQNKANRFLFDLQGSKEAWSIAHTILLSSQLPQAHVYASQILLHKIHHDWLSLGEPDRTPLKLFILQALHHHCSLKANPPLRDALARAVAAIGGRLFPAGWPSFFEEVHVLLVGDSPDLWGWLAYMEIMAGLPEEVDRVRRGAAQQEALLQSLAGWFGPAVLDMGERAAAALHDELRGRVFRALATWLEVVEPVRTETKRLGGFVDLAFSLLFGAGEVAYDDANDDALDFLDVTLQYCSPTVAQFQLVYRHLERWGADGNDDEGEVLRACRILVRCADRGADASLGQALSRCLAHGSSNVAGWSLSFWRNAGAEGHAAILPVAVARIRYPDGTQLDWSLRPPRGFDMGDHDHLRALVADLVQQAASRTLGPDACIQHLSPLFEAEQWESVEAAAFGLHAVLHRRSLPRVSLPVLRAALCRLFVVAPGRPALVAQTVRVLTACAPVLPEVWAHDAAVLERTVAVTTEALGHEALCLSASSALHRIAEAAPHDLAGLLPALLGACALRRGNPVGLVLGAKARLVDAIMCVQGVAPPGQQPELLGALSSTFAAVLAGLQEQTRAVLAPGAAAQHGHMDLSVAQEETEVRVLEELEALCSLIRPLGHFEGREPHPARVLMDALYDPVMSLVHQWRGSEEVVDGFCKLCKTCAAVEKVQLRPMLAAMVQTLAKSYETYLFPSCLRAIGALAVQINFQAGDEQAADWSQIVGGLMEGTYRYFNQVGSDNLADHAELLQGFYEFVQCVLQSSFAAVCPELVPPLLRLGTLALHVAERDTVRSVLSVLTALLHRRGHHAPLAQILDEALADGRLLQTLFQILPACFGLNLARRIAGTLYALFNAYPKQAVPWIQSALLSYDDAYFRDMSRERVANAMLKSLSSDRRFTMFISDFARVLTFESDSSCLLVFEV
mmetsp:Transcript_35463/g.99915  ORF Transcript_35463/g.99915 Transcript_35463/m.99915 type:complete len:930 (+) Transcript_35463:128-2917(+)|eukprot:CAMPEP_0119145496 /NCGR_PEP_ID=MMETSP1310-20130426/37614_1 /TAXON_ID=464262 /ORGANISM="Genus nov. species nov., Strain RCC2339" /LENGTH=929 /DNA_ID=CAMNT_0007137315 /DNA_START=53 /DNA_END=2842 /DNA_ORIENTATION=+